MNQLLMSVNTAFVASLKGTLITLEIFDLVMHTFNMPQQVVLFTSLSDSEIGGRRADNLQDDIKAESLPDNSEYVAEIQEGKKRGSINYVIGNKMYVKNLIYKGTIHASCLHKVQKGCRGRAAICQEKQADRSSYM